MFPGLGCAGKKAMRAEVARQLAVRNIDRTPNYLDCESRGLCTNDSSLGSQSDQEGLVRGYLTQRYWVMGSRFLLQSYLAS
jgi:hypothetical protein